jgi:hypothetical protein
MMSNPMQIWNAWFALSSQAVRLGLDAQNVIALRLMRMAGGGALGHAEAERMVTEKFAALAEAQSAVALAVVGGNSQNIGEKVLGIYGKHVRGNRRRLTR